MTDRIEFESAPAEALTPTVAAWDLPPNPYWENLEARRQRKSLAIAILLSRWQFWSVLLMAVLFQKVENFFIAPRLMSRQVSISPLAVFVAFMIGASLLGIVGAIMAIPGAVIAQVAFEEVFVARRERRRDESRAGTLTKRRD